MVIKASNKLAGPQVAKIKPDPRNKPVPIEPPRAINDKCLLLRPLARVSGPKAGSNEVSEILSLPFSLYGIFFSSSER